MINKKAVMNISCVVAIAKNGFREIIRDRILYVIFFFILLLVLASRILPPIALGADEKIFLDLGIGAISILGALVSIFVGAGMLNKEIDKKTVLVLVPKPITSTDLIIGKHLGLFAVLVVFVSITTIVYFFMMSIFAISYSPVSLLVAIAYLLLELALLTAVAMTFGAFSSSLLATLFTVGIYFVGHLSRDLLELGKIADNSAVKQITQTLFLVVPDLERFNLRNEAVYNTLPNSSELLSSFLYALLYTALLLTVTTNIFARRQF